MSTILPAKSANATPAVLCAGSGGLLIGFGIGLGKIMMFSLWYEYKFEGVGYLVFWYPLRNSGGLWLGQGGAGFWLPQKTGVSVGRKRRFAQDEND